MQDTVSVVVPVYNAEKWLLRCVESIVRQPYQFIELILVNDGSSDKSPLLCEQLAQEDARVIVIHKENGGPSSARNAGIEAATGTYITFIDPDDEVQENYFMTLYIVAKAHECDAVIGGYTTVPENRTTLPGFTLRKVLSGKELILTSPHVHSQNDLCFPWRYMYRRRIMQERNIRFREDVHIGEDVLFNLEFLLASERVCAAAESVYLYTVNNLESIMRKPYKPELESSLIKQYAMRRELSERHGLLADKHYRSDMANYYMKHIYTMLINNLRKSSETDIDRAIRRIVNYDMFRESLKDIGFMYECANWKEYMYYLALKFKLYSVITSAYNRM